MDSSPMTSDDLSLPQTPAVGTFEENVIAFVEARKSIEDDGILGEVHTYVQILSSIPGASDELFVIKIFYRYDKDHRQHGYSNLWDD